MVDGQGFGERWLDKFFMVPGEDVGVLGAVRYTTSYPPEYRQPPHNVCMLIVYRGSNAPSSPPVGESTIGSSNLRAPHQRVSHR